ncbi:LacI family DNA-binding transcriptional regulator [Arthrobacter sp. FW305-BF8]|uniref:LacI family DNA-binding transcriptional regulator n=1 Tax=Arthrobacter sp. FW305-BF8 TaxID=2879617 RepID=UPI001F009D51|nr:LacI family DNA-binding transcriptional regulator [Arthrobacter sp. FW305-BF8]UKA53957.1 LacI family DNA-binding transcriptional regulator [Arthrobacter sp. FW305-BF8]
MAMAPETEIPAANPGSPAARAADVHVHAQQSTGIREVAAAAGVSTATVSRALRGLPRVSQSTRQRIEAAAANLGYVASSAASELARRRGDRRATLPEQLMRVQPPASGTAEFSRTGSVAAPGHPASPGRGTIVVVNGPLTDPGIPDERGVPTPAGIEQLVQSIASAHGFTVCVKSCQYARMPDAVRSAAASAVGIIINTGSLSPVSTELHAALASVSVPTVEIRTNNLHPGKIGSGPPSFACTVLISGAGIYGYKLAIDYLDSAVQSIRVQPDTERWMATAAAPRAH